MAEWRVPIYLLRIEIALVVDETGWERFFEIPFEKFPRHGNI